MKKKQSRLRLLGHTVLSGIFLIGLLAIEAQTLGAEAERMPKEKPATRSDFVLTVKDTLISLKANKASLKEILEEIGRRMKIEVFALLPEQERITDEFKTLPLEEAIKRLRGTHSHLIVSQENGRNITKIIVLDNGKTAISRHMAKESALKEERSTKPETREEAIRKEHPRPEPFEFQFDPSRYGEKRR